MILVVIVFRIELTEAEGEETGLVADDAPAGVVEQPWGELRVGLVAVVDEVPGVRGVVVDRERLRAYPAPQRALAIAPVWHALLAVPEVHSSTLPLHWVPIPTFCVVRTLSFHSLFTN